MDTAVTNAHAVLAVAIDATPEQVRSAYLRLVRQHPPDRDPDKFREIHVAYQLLSDPLVQAQAFLTPAQDPPDLTEVIDAAEKKRPRLPKLALLALGNQNSAP